VIVKSSLSVIVVLRLLKRVLNDEMKDCLRLGTYQTSAKRCFA